MKKYGRLELSLLTPNNGTKVAVTVTHAGERSQAMFEDVVFATGGAITLVHLPPANALV